MGLSVNTSWLLYLGSSELEPGNEEMKDIDCPDYYSNVGTYNQHIQSFFSIFELPCLSMAF